jgi:hypothetical protein
MEEYLLPLLKYVFPAEIIENFALTGIKELDKILHIYFEEYEIKPSEHSDKELRANGFYEESEIKDFPLRDRKVVLHIKRRRWIDNAGKSYSRQWNLTADGTRYAKEFAFFFKKAFGHLPDSSPIS